MYNFDFKKTLGQNFLKDDNIVNKIVNATEYKKNNLVIEIGPGAGSLTKKLLPKVDKAILYEIDTRLERILNKELAVANLPYYITTPIISKIIEEKIPACEIVIMIQKEVADRLCALVGTKEYGQLTVFLNYFYDIKRVTNVSKNSFVPKPKVDSAVIKMVKKNNLEYVKDLDFFRKIVKDSFRFKRKTIKNNLCNYDINIIESVLEKYNFNINTRSENIPYYVFVELANELLK